MSMRGTQIAWEQMHSEEYFRKFVENTIVRKMPDFESTADKAADMLEEWAESKENSDELSELDFQTIAERILIASMFWQEATLFTNVASSLAGILNFDNKPHAVTMVAGMLAVVVRLGWYEIFKTSDQGSLLVQSEFEWPEAVKAKYEKCQFLPPMLHKPEELHHSYSNPYLETNTGSLILGGKDNHHSGNICVDVLNTQNRIKLSLNEDLLYLVDEEASFELDDVFDEDGTLTFEEAKSLEERKRNWQNFKRRSAYVYTKLLTSGNEFYITNKVDKRGRIYSQGYHVSPQGAPFKKAILELANKEIIEVPEEFKHAT